MNLSWPAVSINLIFKFSSSTFKVRVSLFVPIVAEIDCGLTVVYFIGFCSISFKTLIWLIKRVLPEAEAPRTQML
jgi:hypothetical protein